MLLLLMRTMMEHTKICKQERERVREREKHLYQQKNKKQMRFC